MIHELRWALFGGLLSLPDCDSCGGRGAHHCDAALALTHEGAIVGRQDHPDVIVSWPGCPRQWAAMRRWGQDAISLADQLRWEVDRGAHMRPDLPAGSARLLREYLSLRDWPTRMAEARAVRAAREGRGGS